MAFIDKTKGGRYFVYLPKHPRANAKGCVKRARIVMEKKLERLLTVYICNMVVRKYILMKDPLRYSSTGK